MINPSPSLPYLLDTAIEAFQTIYDRPPQWQGVAPGRVNLIGDHTDYNDGWALPMAIDRYTVAVAAERQSDATLHLHSMALGEEASLPLEQLGQPHPQQWVRYVQGVVIEYHRLGVRCPALDLLIASSLPAGGGLSSSAALEMAVAYLLEMITGVQMPSYDRIQACVRAERQMAGVPCGVMDQTVVDMAEAGHALALDCANHVVTPVGVSLDQVSLLVAHSGVSHALAEDAYAQRRQECEQAAERLGVPTLRELDLDDIDRLADDALLLRRVRHVVTENARVQQAVTAMRRGDWANFGALMTESHASLRDNYEVSCDELNQLVELASAEPGVLGARMTGGGFGGSAIILVEFPRLEDVAISLCSAYLQETGYTPACFQVRAPAGARKMNART